MDNIDIRNYQTLIFDCDGVVLNSNKIKTQAFYEATKHYGDEPAQALVDYHIQNGGISRYAKFEYFLTEIMQQAVEQDDLETLLISFADIVKQGLLACEVAKGLEQLKEQTKDSNWLIVSGGDQAELREVFSERDLDRFFDGGIFGSPLNKEIILKNEIKKCNIIGKSLFLGDSVYDHKVSTAAQMDFIFLSKWTEVHNWESWTSQKKISNIKDIQELCSL